MENEILKPNDRISIRTVRRFKKQLDAHITSAINDFVDATGLSIDHVELYQKTKPGQQHKNVQAVTYVSDIG